MEEVQYGTIRIGQIVKLFADGIGFDALLDSVKDELKDSTKKRIQRLENEEGRIDNLREFESLLKEFCNWAVSEKFINQAHQYIIPTLYYDMLALIPNTNPYNNPTKNEVELQVMYCIALTYREIYDHLKKKEGLSDGDTLQLTLGMFDFWIHNNHSENVKLIPSCFAFLFSVTNAPKARMYEYWDSLRDNNDKKSNPDDDKIKNTISKNINDWTQNNVIPKWANLKILLSSPKPATINFLESDTNYTLFKTKLFLGTFFTNFFNSLEEQKLVSTDFKETVQNGIRWYYWYLFENKGNFSVYKTEEVKNPMFSLMRFLVHPTERNRLVSEYIYEAFDKEIGPYEGFGKSLYFIPKDRIHFPILNVDEQDDIYKIYQIIFETFNELSTDPTLGNFKNKIIKEHEIDMILNLPVMGICKEFYYNWFKGKYHVLCHDFEGGLEYYKKAFENRYFGGKALYYFLDEIVVLMKKCNEKKVEINHIYEWANAIRLTICSRNNINNNDLQKSFNDVFPEEAFIK